MPTLRLNAVLGLNKTGFDAGMKEAQKNVDRFASSMARRVGSAILAAFSVQKLAQFGQRVIEQGAEIDKLSKKFNLTTDEVQLLQHEAKRTGQTFNDLVSDAEKLETTLARLRGGEVIFSRSQVQELADAHEKLQAFSNELAKLTARSIENPGSFLKRVLGFGNDAVRKRFGVADPDDEGPQAVPAADDFLAKEAAAKRAQQRAAEIARETATIREQIGKRLLNDEETLVQLAAKREEIFNRITKTAVERAQKERDLAANELAIAQVTEAANRKADKGEGGPGGFTPLENPLGNIGAFSGGNTNPSAQVLSELKKIHDALVLKGIIVRDTK